VSTGHEPQPPALARAAARAGALLNSASSRAYPNGYADLACFPLDGQAIPHFVHRFNAFHPPARMTERTIELALADIFLGGVDADRVVEVGAVTPYYWPGRLRTVIDPADDHDFVSDRIGWSDWAGSGETILSISTFEHIGAGEYGLAPDPSLTSAAVDKLLQGHETFLVTYPAGYNPELDLIVAAANRTSPGWRILVWHRGTRGNDWRQIGFDELTPALCTYGPAWANTLVALYRGPEDLWRRGAGGEASRPAS